MTHHYLILSELKMKRSYHFQNLRDLLSDIDLEQKTVFHKLKRFKPCLDIDFNISLEDRADQKEMMSPHKLIKNSIELSNHLQHDVVAKVKISPDYPSTPQGPSISKPRLTRHHQRFRLLSKV